MAPRGVAELRLIAACCLPNGNHMGSPNGRCPWGEPVSQQRDGRRAPPAPGGSDAGRESPARSALGVEDEQLPLAFWGAIGTGQILLWQAYRAR